MCKTVIFLVFLQCISGAFCANILYVAPMPSPSHHIWNRALAFGLMNKGHNVTHVGPDPESMKTDNYTHILLEGIYDALEEDHYNNNELALAGPMTVLFQVQRYFRLFCQASAKSKGLQALLNYPEDFQFDLIVFDISGGTCLYPLIQRFKYPPVVAVTPFLLPTYVANNLGNHLYPAYVPWYCLPYSQNMTFLERVWNFIFTYADAVIGLSRYQVVVNNIMKEIFGEDVDTVEELEKHISLVLTNIDPLTNFIQPLAPHFIPVGGLHTRVASKLPQDLQRIMDDSKNGVILFSLGTNIYSDQLETKTREALLEAFSQIKETVIWKFESDIDNLPKNVIVRKWLPQNDILGHPNIKLFLGHGGALSTQESIFHGVPMVLIPFIVDQEVNTNILVDRDLAVFIDFKKITSDYVLDKLREALDNPKYLENVQKVSKIFKDQPQTPLERGVFWTEYVLRHQGAHFLNSPTRNLPFYVSSSLDVVVFLTLIAVIVIFSTYKIFRIVGSIFTNKLNKRKVKKN